MDRLLLLSCVLYLVTCALGQTNTSLFTCDAIGLVTSDSQMYVGWKCCSLNQTQSIRCPFKYKQTFQSGFNPILPSEIKMFRDEAMADGRTCSQGCELRMNVKQLVPSQYQFQVTMQGTDASGTDVSFGGPLESALLTLETPAPTCERPVLTNNYTDVSVVCHANRSSYSVEVCVVYFQDRDGGSVRDVMGKTSSTCFNTPVLCTITCTASLPVLTMGEGGHHVRANMVPVIDKMISRGSKSPVISLSLPSPELRNCPSGPFVKGGYIKAGTAGQCLCWVPDMGNPPATITWSSSTGGNVNTRDTTNGTGTFALFEYDPTGPTKRFACKISSIFGEKKTKSFTPEFAYGPRDIYMTINDGSENPIKTSTKFNVSCDVTSSSFHPDVVMALTFGTELVNVSERTQREGLRRNVFTVQSKKSGNFSLTCTAKNTKFPDLTAVTREFISVADNNDNGEGLGLGEILGIVSAALGVLSVIVAVVICACKKGGKDKTAVNS